MKKFYCWLVLLFSGILFISCKDIMLSETELPEGGAPASTVVTPEMAQAEVERLLSDIDVPTRSGKKREISDLHILGGFGHTRASEDAQEEPLVYLFNFKDDEGYALMSGDTRVSSVLAFAERGNIDPEEGVDNPGLIMFLSNADTYYRAKVGLPIYDEKGDQVYYNPADPANPIPVDAGDGFIIAPPAYVGSDWRTWGSTGEVIPCQWNQTSPFNKYCFTADGRQAPAGCVAVAVAQLMYHYGKNVTYNGTYYNWNTMRTVINGREAQGDAAKDMVAKLLFQLGRPQNLNMNYEVGSSGAYSENVPRTFINFGYSKGGTLQAYDVIYLCHGPLYVEGSAKKKTIQHRFLGINTWQEVSYHEAHAWVIDRKIHQEQKLYTVGGKYVKTIQRELVHCNWGWGGRDDGYYYDGAFNTNEGPENPTRSQTYWEGVSRYYQYNLKMVTGIEP